MADAAHDKIRNHVLAMWNDLIDLTCFGEGRIAHRDEINRFVYDGIDRMLNWEGGREIQRQLRDD